MTKNYIVKKIVDLPLFPGAVQGTEFVAFQDPSTLVTYRIEASKIGGADKLVKDFSTLDDATLPLSGTEIVAIWDGTGNKKVEVSNFAGGGGGDDTHITASNNHANLGVTVGEDYDSVLTKISNKFGGLKETIQFAVSDETTPILSAENLFRTRMPFGLELTNIKASLNTDARGARFTIDIKKGGTSIFSTLLSFNLNATTTIGSSVPYVLTTTTLEADALISIDVTQVGSNINYRGSGLKITLEGTRL